MAFDTYLTKTATPNSATTFYPTGVIQSGGSAVDEFDVHKTPLGNQMALAVIVPSVAGTSTPTMTVSIQSDDNTSFSSAAERSLGLSAAITATGRYEFSIPYIPERYLRVKLVNTGTNPDFGTVTVGIIPAGNLYRQAP